MQSVNEAVQEHPSLNPAVFPQHAAAYKTNAEAFILLQASSLLEVHDKAPEKYSGVCPCTRDFAGNRIGLSETENSQMFKIHCKRLFHGKEIF